MTAPMEQVDTDTTMLPLDVAAELQRLRGLLGELDEGERDERARLHWRQAQIYLGLNATEVEREALEQLWAAWEAAPGDRDVLVVLGSELERRGDSAALLRLLARGAGQARDGLHTAHWLAKAIELLLQAKDDADLDGPLAALEEVLGKSELLRQFVHYAPQTARQLIATLREAGHLSLALLVLTTLTVERHDARTFEDALLMARLNEELGQKQRAFEAYRTALSLRPAAAAALEPTRRHLLDDQQYEQLAELLAVSAPAAETPGERAQLWRELAQLAEQKLSDRNRAVQAWWRAWELAQTGEEPAEIKRLYAEDERWTRYLDVLRQEALRTTNVKRKIEIFHELATFQQEVLADDAEAATTYELLLQLAPHDNRALEQLVALRLNLLAADPQPTSAAATQRALRRHIDHATDAPKREQLLRQLIELRLEYGPSAGLLGCLRRLDASNPANLTFLEELWERSWAAREQSPLVELRPELALLLLRLRGALPPQEQQAASADLEARCRKEGDEVLAQLIQRQRGLPKPEERKIPAPGSLANQAMGRLAQRAAGYQKTDRKQAVRLLIQAAQVGLGDGSTRQAAQHFLLTARDLCPADARDELLLLESALGEAGMAQEVAALLRKQVERASAPQRRVQLLRALARQLEKGAPEEAATALRELLAVDPHDEQAAQRLRELQEQLGQHDQLARLLVAQLPSAGPDQRRTLLEDLGHLYAEHLDDEDRALRYYGELLRLQPHHRAALAFVRRHAERADDQRAIAVLLSRAAETDDDPVSRAELHRDVARIAERELNDLEFAISQWRQLLALFPEQVTARQELKRILAKAGRFSELEGVLVSDVSREVEESQKVQLYLELARLAQGQLANPRGAANHLRNALQLAPHDPQVLDELATLHEQLGQWRELVSVLEQRAELEEQSSAARTSDLTRAAHVLLEHLGREEEALAHCRRIRELSPGETSAASLMREIYRRRRQWKQLGALLREQIAIETEARELGRLHVEMGQLLLEQLDAPEAAATHFEMALEFESSAPWSPPSPQAEHGQSIEVLTLLRELYAQQQRWDLLVELIRRRALAEGVDKATRADAFCEMGEIFERQLEDDKGAQEAYEQALQLDPSLLPALRALRRLASSKQQWRDAVTLARREFDALQDGGERARLLVEIAAILEQHLARPNAAIDALEQAIEEDPHNAQAIEELAASTFENQSWQRAAELLTRLVDRGEQDDLHVHYYRLAYATEQLGDEDRAFSLYVKSFGREPMYLPTLERLVKLCYTRRQWENTLRIAEAILTSYAESKSEEELADLYVRLGLCELHLAQTTVAVHKLRELALGPGQRPRTSDDAWQDVASAWATTPADPCLLQDLDFKVITRVIKAMEQALTRVSDHVGALQVLAALTMSRGDWDRALRYLERVADSSRLDDRRLHVELLLAAGDIAAHRLLSTRRAEDYYRRAGELAPNAERVRLRLERMSDRPPRASGPRAPRMAPRSRPRRKTPLAVSVPPPPPPMPRDEEFDELATRPLPQIADYDDSEPSPPPDPRMLPRKKN